MVMQQNKETTGKEGRGALITCFVFFGIYFLNVLLGKVNITYGLNLPYFENVMEFLLLSMASVFLIIAALKAEAAEK